MVDYELAKFEFGPGAKGFARITQDRCPALPESCSISSKEMPQRGRRFTKTGRNCFNVLRTG
jgi:hypothetical protein